MVTRPTGVSSSSGSALPLAVSQASNRPGRVSAIRSNQARGPLSTSLANDASSSSSTFQPSISKSVAPDTSTAPPEAPQSKKRKLSASEPPSNLQPITPVGKPPTEPDQTLKKKPGAPKGRRKPKRTAVTFSTLPLEVMQHIAGFLLDPGCPSPRDSSNPLLGPHEYRYSTPRSLSYPAGVPERWGAVPAGVRDVMSLSRTCHIGYQACAEIFAQLAVYGKNTPWEEELTAEEIESLSKKEIVYLEMPIDSIPAARRIRETLMACRRRVQKIVIHTCWHSPTGASDPSLCIKELPPFQNDLEKPSTKNPRASSGAAPPSTLNDTLSTPVETSVDRSPVVFEKLQDFQLGPDLCRNCFESIGSLFFASDFRLLDDTTNTWDTKKPNIVHSWRLTEDDTRRYFSGPAAPNVKVLTIHIPEYQASASHMTGRPDETLDWLLSRIRTDDVQGLEILQVWTAGYRRSWRGFGMSGYSNAVPVKKMEVVEGEVNDALNKEKQAAADILNAALVKEILARQGSKTSVSVAETIAQREQRLLDKFKLKAKAALTGASTIANSATSSPVPDTSSSTPRPNGSCPPQSASIQTSNLVQKVKTEAQDTADRDGSDNHSDDDSPSDYDPMFTPAQIADMRMDAGRARRAMDPTTKDISYRQMLTKIATCFPDLLGLQILRRGSDRNDIVERGRMLDDVMNDYVYPIRNMKRLRWLDLGLAIVGRKEVADFPLGFEVSKVPGKGGPLAPKFLDLTNKARVELWNKRIDVAIEEGNAWREKVMQAFISDCRRRAQPESSSGSGMGDDHDDNDAEKKPAWPKTLESGWVYSVDLRDRAKRHGVVLEWSAKVDAPMTTLAEGGTKGNGKVVVFHEPKKVFL